MADVLGGSSEPSSKKQKLSGVAGLDAAATAFLRTEALHLAASSGVLLGADGPFSHAPLSLLPYPYPKSLFQQAKALAMPFSLLCDRISRDLDWLCDTVRSVVKDDEFTRRLLEIAEKIKSEGAVQPLQLGIYRSDYMVHQPSEEDVPRLMQVELNTISCSFVTLASKLSGMHRHLVPRAGAAGPAAEALRAQPALAAALADPKLELLPHNESLSGIAAAIAQAHGEYVAAMPGGGGGGGESKSPVVLMVVQPTERNVIDQRGVDHQLWHAHGVPMVRASLADLQRTATLSADRKALLLTADGGATPTEVSVVYFRAGYTPNDYAGEAEWEARLLLERSLAVKCPSIGQHLAGTKKVQQVLADPAQLARFMDAEQAAVLRSSFAGLYGLDEDGGDAVEAAVARAIERPEAYVLKPQREGGGNNLYGEELRDALRTMSRQERASYILMQRIVPPTHPVPLMRDGALDGGECIGMARVAVLAVLVRPSLATTGSSGCSRRLEAALGSHEERPSASDPTERPWPSRQRPPKSTISPRFGHAGASPSSASTASS